MLLKINFVGSSLAECILVGTLSCVKNDKRKAREREIRIATFDEIDEQLVGKLNPMRDKNVTGGRRDDTCPHGLSRRVKPPTSKRLESKNDDTNTYII